MILLDTIQEIILKLTEILKQNAAINEQVFCETVGVFSKELKVLLQKYFESDEKMQDELRPYLNYYRQLQYYLVFLVMNSEILQVPNHSEILQTLSFIENQEKLIQELYIGFSEEQKRLLTGDFREILDKILEARFTKSKE
jgi:hypothetical protein